MLWQLPTYLQISRDRRGAIAPLVALTLPALIGAMALAVDVGFLYVEHQRLQIAADAAATGAALLLPARRPPPNCRPPRSRPRPTPPAAR